MGWRRRLSKFELDVVLYAGIIHKTADTLLRQKETGEEESSIEYDILVQCITAFNTPEKQEARFTCMQDDDAENEKRGVRLPEVDALAMATDGNDENRPITVHEIIDEQTNESYCRQASYAVGLPGSTYSFDKIRFLKQTAPNDGAVQKVAPTPFEACLLYQSHYLTLPGHLGRRHMYDRTRRKDYSKHMVNEVYTTLTVRECRECIRNKCSEKCWRS